MDAHGAMLNEGHRCQRCGGNLVLSEQNECVQCLLCSRPAPNQAGVYSQFFGRRRRPRAAAMSEDSRGYAA